MVSYKGRCKVAYAVRNIFRLCDGKANNFFAEYSIYDRYH